MFYCNSCADECGWPKNTIIQSYGLCELCEKKDLCNDVPSKFLPEIKPEPRDSTFLDWEE